VGGLAGAQGAGSIADGYYDASTTGQSGGVGSGETTATLQGALPTFANSSLWSTGPGLYPYLTNFFPNGVQAISGFAYSDAGKTAAAGASVGAVVGGAMFGSASVGANGYYYILAPAGSAASGATLLAYGNDAATLTTASGGTVQTGVDLYGEALTGTTSDTTYSAALTDLTAAMTTAANGNSGALTAISGATGAFLTANGASFTIDQAVTTSGAFGVATTQADAPLTVSQAITINGAGGLVLNAAGALAIDAPITVVGAAAVNLAAAGGYGFGLSGSGFAGSLSFTGAGGSLNIDGTPYTLITSLPELASDLNGSYGDYALAGSITSSTGYTAAVVGSFGGTFTGLGNTISGLTITGASTQAGLFDLLAGGGEIRDIGLVGGSVAGGSTAGALVGKAEGLITDAYSTASVSGTSDVGGLVGYVSDLGVISNDWTSGGAVLTGVSGVGGLVGKNQGTIEAGSSSSDAVTGTRYAGGVAGYNSGDISGAGAGTGNVSGTSYVGGLVGYNAATGTLSGDTTSAAKVSGTSVIGGLVGENLGTLEAASSSSDPVSGTKEVGGLAGYNDGNISSASATGSVTGSGGEPLDLGGLVGDNGSAGVITTSQATGGSVSAPGGFHLGGLVGDNAGQISQSFATETVGSNGTGEDLGGLVGYTSSGSEITNTYATGQVEAGIDVGGLVGDNAGGVATSWASGAVASGATSGGVVGGNKTTGLFTNVYWDLGTTGRPSAFGVGTLGASTNVTGIGGTTDKNPHSQSTYTGFNFTSVWTINPGASRPYLRDATPQTPPN